MASVSDFLLSSTAARTGLWVALLNNSTGIRYIASAVTTSSGSYTITGVPAGDYSLQTGITNTGPWVSTDDVHYTVANSVLTIFSLTDQANVFPDASKGDYLKLSAGGSRTINIPANPVTGQLLRFEIKNNTGGAIVTTWVSVFKLAGGSWTDPATTKKRVIVFMYDGTNWIEQSRSSGDI